jgi:hypothetical protein
MAAQFRHPVIPAQAGIQPPFADFMTETGSVSELT